MNMTRATNVKTLLRLLRWLHDECKKMEAPVDADNVAALHSKVWDAMLGKEKQEITSILDDNPEHTM